MSHEVQAQAKKIWNCVRILSGDSSPNVQRNKKTRYEATANPTIATADV